MGQFHCSVVKEKATYILFSMLGFDHLPPKWNLIRESGVE